MEVLVPVLFMLVHAALEHWPVTLVLVAVVSLVLVLRGLARGAARRRRAAGAERPGFLAHFLGDGWASQDMLEGKVASATPRFEQSRAHRVALQRRASIEGARPSRPDRRAQLGLPLLDKPDDMLRFLGLASMSELVHLCDPASAALGRFNKVPWSNYRVRRIPKRDGKRHRIIHAPKPRLKAAQRRILRAILDKVPAHPAATAFRPGLSARDHAARHCGRQVVACWDLLDFFPSIRRRRVTALFLWMGYPLSVARILSMLTTTNGPKEGREWERVLPQGAPTSPAIANALAFRMDCRLSGVARRFGASYSRYADDITFSGDEAMKRGLRRMIPLVEAIIHDCGFQLNRGKRRVQRRGRRQVVTGLVVNAARPSAGREEFDALKAILHNARRAGSLESQDREGRGDFAAHVRGRIEWVRASNPGKGEKLLRLFHAVAGGPPPPPGPAVPDLPPPA